MDPNATLLEMRAAVRDIMRTWDDCNADGSLTPGQQEHVASVANDLAERVQALDQWLSGGGPLPRPWQPKFEPVHVYKS